MSEPLCIRYSKLYKGKPQGQGCFGNLNVGREYICPNVGAPANPYPEPNDSNPWFADQYRKSISCHTKGGNMGYNVLCGCPGKRKKGQSGGGGSRMGYSTTGDMQEFDCNCNKGGAGQSGGGKKRKNSKKRACREKVPNNFNYPRSSCACNPSSDCKYIKFNNERQYGNINREVPGSRFDLAAPAVAKRPVQTEYDNSCKYGSILKEGEKVTNYKGRKFNCTQPFWTKPCI